MNNPIKLQSREENSNFHHLVMDVVWFGIALAASSRFLPVYAIRLSATPIELGLISSLPALVLLFSTLLAGWWRRRYGDGPKAFFWPNLGFRLSLLLCALTPLFPPAWQPVWLILSVSLPAVPQGIFSVNFVILIYESVDKNRITALSSRRALAMNFTVACGALLFGLWLEKSSSPFNYPVMFLVAFVCALFSMREIMKLKVLFPAPIEQKNERRAAPWRVKNFMTAPILGAAIHAAFFALAPVVPMRLVHELGFGEGFMAMFGLLELAAAALIAMRTSWIVEHVGNLVMLALAMMGISLAAMMMAFTTNPYIILVAGALTGAAWGAAQVGIFSFFTDNAPHDDMTRYTTFYHGAVFMAMFIGPMLGSILMDIRVNLVLVLVMGAVLRLSVGMLALYIGWPVAVRLWRAAHR